MGATAELHGHIPRTRPVDRLLRRPTAPTPIAPRRRPAMQVVEIDEADGELDRVRQRRRRPGGPKPQPLDRAAVMFTSGTTGAPKGVEITQANYAFAGTTMAAACDLQAYAPPARRAAVVPRQRAVLLVRLGHRRRCVGGADAHVLGQRLPGPGCPPRRHARQPVRRADPHDPGSRRAPRVAGVRLQHCWYAMNISDDQYATLVVAARLPATPAVRHDRDHPGGAHRSCRHSRSPRRWASSPTGCAVDVQRRRRCPGAARRGRRDRRGRALDRGAVLHRVAVPADGRTGVIPGAGGSGEVRPRLGAAILVLALASAILMVALYRPAPTHRASITAPTRGPSSC